MNLPCRYCAKPVALQGYAQTWLIRCNTVLRGRGEPELAKDEILVCKACHPRWEREAEAKSAREEVALRDICDAVANGQSYRVPPEHEHRHKYSAHWKNEIQRARRQYENGKSGGEGRLK